MEGVELGEDEMDKGGLEEAEGLGGGGRVCWHWKPQGS